MRTTACVFIASGWGGQKLIRGDYSFLCDRREADPPAFAEVGT